MPKGIPLTDEEQQRRRTEIFASSVDLILDKGFNETSMQEIAEAAGIGKSTLYDYYKNKDEILVFYFENEIKMITECAREVVRQNTSASAKLRKIMLLHLDYLMDNKRVFLKLSFEAQRLSFESQDRIQAARHAYQDLLRNLIEDGVQNKEFRPVNSLFAARSIFSLLSLAVFTSRPTGTPEEMLEEALDILFKGIQG